MPDAPPPLPPPPINVRVLAGMALGAVVATVGALFLGEYEFDELLPIGAGALLGYLVAEIVVSVGGHRSRPMAAMLACGSAVAVLLAGSLDANEIEPIKWGTYLSALLAAGLAAMRGNDWRGEQAHRRAEAEALDETAGRQEADGFADLREQSPVSADEPQATAARKPRSPDAS